MKRTFIVAAGFILATGCSNPDVKGTSNTEADSTQQHTTAAPNQPQLFLNLPDTCNTPDGLAHNSDSSAMYLSMPNLNDPSATPGIYLIRNDSLIHFTDLPPSPTTGHVAPMDLAVGPDGNLYINDNQYELFNKDYKSRLLKVTIQNGKPVRVSAVVEGFRLANGMVWKGNDLYITDSQWDTPQDTAKSAIFHFTLAELNKGPLLLLPGFSDPHILDTFTTHISEDKIDNGVDGIDYDSKGNLYTGMFGDGTIYKLTLSSNGDRVAKKEVFVPMGPIGAADGFIIDRSTDKLYVTDAKRNAIRVVDSTGAVSTLWENGDTDGSNGLLDQPAEVLLKNNRLYISNFDKPSAKDFTNSKFDKPYTMSVINFTK